MDTLLDEVVPEIIQEKGDYGGHKIVTVAPGHRLVRVFSFLDEYRIKEPGDYQVTVRYESNGQVVERDPKTSKLVTKKATPCSFCLLYTSPSPRDLSTSRMPSSA